MTTKKEENALTAPAQVGLTVPDWMKEDTSGGTEHLTQNDITIPRIGLAQQMSYQLDPSHSLYMEDLKVGELFNTLTGENWHKGPLDFVILRADKPRYIEFYPREQGGGIKDMNVKEGDPRCDFGPNGEVPAATKFYDYLCLRLPFPEDIGNITDNVVALSLKSTGLKVAKQINTLLMLRRPKPVYASVFRLTTSMDQNKHGKFAIYVVKSIGYVQDQATGEMLKELSESLRKMTVKIHDDTPADDLADDSMAGGEEGGSTDFPTGDDTPTSPGM